MKCANCSFYKSGFQWNCCELTQSECFYKLEDCNLINNDKSINEIEIKKIFG